MEWGEEAEEDRRKRGENGEHKKDCSASALAPRNRPWPMSPRAESAAIHTIIMNRSIKAEQTVEKKNENGRDRARNSSKSKRRKGGRNRGRHRDDNTIIATRLHVHDWKAVMPSTKSGTSWERVEKGA